MPNTSLQHRAGFPLGLFALLAAGAPPANRTAPPQLTESQRLIRAASVKGSVNP
jgi:hypothetical protein